MLTARRSLGARGPVVGAIGLGCMGMSWAYAEQQQSDDESIALIRYALDHGTTLLDTADIYGPFTNERLVGRAIADRREDITLASKAGLIAELGATAGDITLRPDGRPEHLRQACDDSLARLGVDHIDLYYLHRVDPAVPVEDSWGALAELQQAGKVRHLGISEASVEQLRAVNAIHPVTAVQSELSLWTRDPLESVLPWCVSAGAAFVPFAPLGRGFLTGRFAAAEPDRDDFRAGLPRFQASALADNRRILDTLSRIAAQHEATPGQIALAWVLAQGEHVVPIPGTTKARHLDENLAAADITLDAEEVAALDALPAPTGSRY